jgi:F-type H+-transporting ATPase subunit alpha
LKQGQYQPMSVERQVVVIFAGTNGYLDAVPMEKIKDYEGQLSEFLDRKYPEIYSGIIQSGKLDDIKEKLITALKEFAGTFNG